MIGDIFKRKGVVVGSILFGTLIGGSIGVYIRDNWDIEARVGLKCIIELYCLFMSCSAQKDRLSLGVS